MSAQAALHALRLALGAPDPTPEPGTRTSTGAVSPADLELARYLSLLDSAAGGCFPAALQVALRIIGAQCRRQGPLKPGLVRDLGAGLNHLNGRAHGIRVDVLNAHQ